jgi:hypothetical protein
MQSCAVAGVVANRSNSATCDEAVRITFSFFIHLSLAFNRCSPPLVLRFYGDGLLTSEDKQIFVAAVRLLGLTRHLTSHIMILGRFHDQMATTGSEGAFQ